MRLDVSRITRALSLSGIKGGRFLLEIEIINKASGEQLARKSRISLFQSLLRSFILGGELLPSNGRSSDSSNNVE